MKIKIPNESSRSLLAWAALVVAFTVVSAPMANALFYNYVRDAYTGWGAGAWTDLNAGANVAACAPAVDSAGGPSWMDEPYTEILEADASYGYNDAYYSASSAYSDWYRYAAFNDLANLSGYLSLIESWRQVYDQLIDALDEELIAAGNAAFEALNAAISAAISAGDFDFDTYNNAVIAAYTSYYDAKYSNDTYYEYAMGEYGYNTWAYYSAPYYGTSIFLEQLASMFWSQYSNSASAAYWDFDAPAFGTPEYEALEVYEQQLEDYYFPIAEYYSVYGDYYRGLSDYYEG